MKTITVKITTFKESGKYYDEWTLTTTVEKDTWYEIIRAVKLSKNGHVAPQRQMDWLIGMDDSRDDMYPIMLKGTHHE